MPPLRSARPGSSQRRAQGSTEMSLESKWGHRQIQLAVDIEGRPRPPDGGTTTRQPRSGRRLEAPSPLPSSTETSLESKLAVADPACITMKSPTATESGDRPGLNLRAMNGYRWAGAGWTRRPRKLKRWRHAGLARRGDCATGNGGARHPPSTLLGSRPLRGGKLRCTYQNATAAPVTMGGGNSGPNGRGAPDATGRGLDQGPRGASTRPEGSPWPWAGPGLREPSGRFTTNRLRGAR